MLVRVPLLFSPRCGRRQPESTDGTSATANRRIKVMISSQCDRTFPTGGRKLTEIRRDIRHRLEDVRLLGQQLFDVWINEDTPGGGLDQNSWDACIKEVRDADILLVLSTGHAGWALTSGDIGICHAELMTARNASPSKIRLISLQGTTPLADEDSDRNERFRIYRKQVNSFSPPVGTEKELFASVDRDVVAALTSLVGAGAREGRKGNFHSGDPGPSISARRIFRTDPTALDRAGAKAPARPVSRTAYAGWRRTHPREGRGPPARRAIRCRVAGHNPRR